MRHAERLAGPDPFGSFRIKAKRTAESHHKEAKSNL
jgi:hypothetical protein